ncbi:response regulator transcription factor [Cohnella terricola]|uniref:Response regulator n=1 Tax=Cohnella terricola TaxID=1289167 RepID=A0A559J9Z1_9BACL|nr:response regulator [Cohnella terricola]TVX96710.1 response regulator [Cohnella terricola]
MRIVVIEDEDNTRYGIVNLIRKLGGSYEVVGDADNGEAGLQLIEDTRPDLVIADIKMPKTSGIEMLEALKSQGHRHMTVILTGFSEYEYAKKALQLGVFEYLEKPVTANDLKSMLEKAEQELAMQQIAGLPPGHASDQLEHALYRWVSQDGLNPVLLPAIKAQVKDWGTDDPFRLLVVYMGLDYDAGCAEAKHGLDDWLKRFGRHALFAIPEDRSFAAIVQGRDLDDLLSLLQSEWLPQMKASGLTAVISVAEVPGIVALKAKYAALKSLRKWFIVIDGSREVLTERLVESLAREPLPYPYALENKLKAAIGGNRGDASGQLLQEWLRLCMTGVYEPRHIVDVSVRLISSALQMIGELYGNDLALRYQEQWLLPILAAETREELTRAFGAIMEHVSSVGQNPESVPYSLTVQKALRLVHEKYAEGITLEEIAAAIRITPEYLSALFAKEVKSNFSAYVKEIRIRKAKTMLLDSKRKMFEIARAVGYPDPKYFSRVFKEVTGLSPAEYQKVNLSR